MVTASYAIPTIDLSLYNPTPLPPSATPTIMPTPTPTSTPVLISAMFSYYDPGLLGVNCHPGNIHDGICGPTASGLDWRGYDRLVAVPLDYPYPLLTHIRVYGPEFLSGDWLVADYCPGCLSFFGQHYLDFLVNSARWCVDVTLPCPIPWGANVIYEVLVP